MPVGAEIFNDSGAYLIDGANYNACFRRKGSVTTTAFYDGRTTLSKAEVAVAADEILAFACIYPTALIGASQGNMRLAVMSAPGAALLYWVFGPPSSSGSFGMQIFNAASQLVYDAVRLPIRIAGLHTGISTSNPPAGKTYAVLAMQTRTQLERTWAEFTPGQGILGSMIRMDAAAVSGNTIITSNQVIDSYTSGLTSGPPVGWELSTSNGATTRYLIVDVSNY